MPTASDDEGMDASTARCATTRDGLIFANLVDFDTHVRPPQRRRRLRRQPRALRRAAGRRCCRALRADDLLVVTADHGNDPTTPSTDHSREYVPLLVAGARVRAGVDLGTRATFADLGQTLADNLRRRRRWRTARAFCEILEQVAVPSIREALEQREREILAPQAAKSADSTRAAARPSPRTTSGRRSSAIAIASSTPRRSGG